MRPQEPWRCTGWLVYLGSDGLPARVQQQSLGYVPGEKWFGHQKQPYWLRDGILFEDYSIEGPGDLRISGCDVNQDAKELDCKITWSNKFNPEKNHLEGRCGEEVEIPELWIKQPGPAPR